MSRSKYTIKISIEQDCAEAKWSTYLPLGVLGEPGLLDLLLFPSVKPSFKETEEWKLA